MAPNYRVAFLGFSDFERSTLASYLRLAVNRAPRYQLAQMLTDADYLVADADHPPSVQLVVATERLAETVFIGVQSPAGASAWMARPIDPMHVLRELDAMVLHKAGSALAPQTPGARPAPEALPSGRAAGGELAPVPDPMLIRERAQATASAPVPLASPTRVPRVLLVDDSEIALRFLETRLQRWELVIDRAASSDKALELLASHSYNLAFVDVELGPDSPLDGLALCQQVKHSAAAVDTAVILVSAHHSELDRVRGALAGCDTYLAKPLDEIELRRLLLRHGLKMSVALTRDPASPA
jgi:CheY-like chemotaxis protein